MGSATEASQMSHIGLGHLDVFSMIEVYRVGGGVEQACRMMALRVAHFAVVVVVRSDP